MRLCMIIFIACLSYSKSLRLPIPSSQYFNASKIPIIGKFLSPSTSTATTINEAPDNSTPDPLQDAYVNILESSEEIKTAVGNVLLKIISQQSNVPNDVVKETVNLLTNLEYWEPVTSKLQNVWDRVKQVGRYSAKTLKKTKSYIKKAVKQFRVYINQGRKLVNTLHNALKSAGEATKDSDQPTNQNLNKVFAQLIDRLKNVKDLFKPDPLEIARDRDSLAE